MKKILIPIDFSDASKRAAKYAFALAKDLWADVHFLHVYQAPLLIGDPLTYGGAVGTTLSAESIANMKTICTERMENFVDSLETEATTKISHSILGGNPVDEIIQFSQENSFNLIVMSTHGESALYRTLFGSVTAAVIRRAEMPILTVPKETSYRTLKRVAYASNQEITDGRTLWQLNKWLKLLKPELHAVHIAETVENKEENVKLMNENLDGLIHRYDSALKVKCHVIANKEISEGLEDFIENHEIDLLIVKTHNRNLLTQWFYPSMAKHLLFHLNKPMLILHENL